VAPPPIHPSPTNVIDRTIPLSQLPAGRAAVVSRILGQPDHVHRLAEFGLRGGTRIEMFRPGNPCIIRLGATKVCLRADDLFCVLVEPVAQGGRMKDEG